MAAILQEIRGECCSIMVPDKKKMGVHSPKRAKRFFVGVFVVTPRIHCVFSSETVGGLMTGILRGHRPLRWNRHQTARPRKRCQVGEAQCGSKWMGRQYSNRWGWPDMLGAAWDLQWEVKGGRYKTHNDAGCRDAKSGATSFRRVSFKFQLLLKQEFWQRLVDTCFGVLQTESEQKFWNRDLNLRPQSVCNNFAVGLCKKNVSPSF